MEYRIENLEAKIATPELWDRFGRRIDQAFYHPYALVSVTFSESPYLKAETHLTFWHRRTGYWGLSVYRESAPTPSIVSAIHWMGKDIDHNPHLSLYIGAQAYQTLNTNQRVLTPGLYPSTDVRMEFTEQPPWLYLNEDRQSIQLIEDTLRLFMQCRQRGRWGEESREALRLSPETPHFTTAQSGQITMPGDQFAKLMSEIGLAQNS